MNTVTQKPLSTAKPSVSLTNASTILPPPVLFPSSCFLLPVGRCPSLLAVKTMSLLEHQAQGLSTAHIKIRWSSSWFYTDLCFQCSWERGLKELKFGDGNSKSLEDYLGRGQDPGKDSKTLWGSPERTECQNIHPSISLFGLRRMKEQGRELQQAPI